jgi:hypothetical protein
MELLMPELIIWHFVQDWQIEEETFIKVYTPTVNVNYVFVPSEPFF